MKRSRRARKLRENQRCYLCGATERLTGDHIPPKNLFPRPRPSDLLTATCCESCNNGASQDDEYFRVAVSSLLDRSEVGERIWHERVLGSTFRARRIGPLIDEVVAETQPVILQSPFGPVEVMAIPFRCEEIHRVLIRMTRGFLSIRHPEFDSSQLDYAVTMVRQFRFEALEPSLVRMPGRFQCGGGIFRCWFGVTSNPGDGIWHYLFYDSAGFVVRHAPKERGILRAA